MPRPVVGPGSIPPGLGEELEQTLGSMAGMSRPAIEASIALLPFGDRVRLATYAVIDTAPDKALADAGWPTDFGLTDEGVDVIALCAERWPSDTPDKRRSQPSAQLTEQLDQLFERTLGPSGSDQARHKTPLI